MTGVQTCALPICFPVTIGVCGCEYDCVFDCDGGCDVIVHLCLIVVVDVNMIVCLIVMVDVM